METREQGNAFLTTIKMGMFSHALQLVQRVGKELIFCDVTTFQGFSFLSQVLDQHQLLGKVDAGGHEINCEDSCCVSIKRIWRIDNIPWVGEQETQTLS